MKRTMIRFLALGSLLGTSNRCLGSDSAKKSKTSTHPPAPTTIYNTNTNTQGNTPGGALMTQPLSASDLPSTATDSPVVSDPPRRRRVKRRVDLSCFLDWSEKGNLSAEDFENHERKEEITGISLYRTKVGEREIQALSQWPKLRRVELGMTETLTDQTVQALRPPNLEELFLDDSWQTLTEAALQNADQWTHLKILSLQGNGFTNKALAKFDLAELTSLTLWGDRFDDQVLADASLPNLEVLLLSGSSFTSRVLDRVNLANLEKLLLWGNRFDDAALQGKELAKMGELTLQGGGFTGRVLRETHLPNLWKLMLNEKTFSDDLLDNAKLPPLEELKLGGNNFTDRALQKVDKSRLKKLWLYGDNFTGEVLQSVKLPKLEKLALEGKKFAKLVLRETLPHLTELTNLKLKKGLGDEVLQGADLSPLKKLILVGDSFTNKAVQGLELTNLETLELYGNNFTLTEEEARKNVDAPNLKKVKIKKKAERGIYVHPLSVSKTSVQAPREGDASP